ncbi:hypothetical protein SE92_23290 [Bradyrhizobium sp. AT1]|uniref:DarT ssDNA thymidine ADP-ribosyltransferase family protein n=1 Tax=Bradyrhizobium sp. AT1 TaxID=574934 RepID=UPI0007929668|nr:DarT ssDNA thymidine ADP-ribosyltransferase family protein [Bradyrhizobium sp. AT1]KYG22779.1 hypothetical protein SE92_23290 [Bradyrhizobium sp. AT1]
MALTLDFINAHIAKWELALAKPFYPYRAKWPGRLFHHAPIQNAVKILLDGNLRSRDDPANAKELDVAAPDVIATRGAAHSFARLYFRPRTPTQWHIEGIRKQGECKWEGAHAPILVMMVFSAQTVLSLQNIKFCDRNMQIGSADPGDSEDYFSKIPFDKVFHEGGTGGDHSIIEHRCAEVLATSPLPLADHLQWIYCRTDAEKQTLLHLMGDKGKHWAQKILISNDLLVFERKYVFVEEVSLASDGVVFKLSPRYDSQNVSVTVKAWDRSQKQIVNFSNSSLSARPAPPSAALRWKTPGAFPNGTYLVEIELEGHLAFKDKLSIGGFLV